MRAARFVVYMTALTVLGCGEEETSIRSTYVVPDDLAALRGETFFDHPWPSDLRLEAGSPRFAGFPNPRSLQILDLYVTSATGKLDGFSPAAAGYLRFDAAIDPSTLPSSPEASLLPDASVQLIDVDPSSPERGQRKLVSVLWREPEGVYYRENTLAFIPTLGFPLRAHTRYALVVTDALRSADGGQVRPSTDLAEVLKGTPRQPRLQRARAVVGPALSELAMAGIVADDIVHLAVFTTSDPTSELFAVRDTLRKTVPPPTMHDDGWRLENSTADFDEYLGAYGPSPNFQAGKLPFANPEDGGSFNYENGEAAVVDLFNLRFSLTVPRAERCPMPASGYPIVMYAHGTGGDFRSYVREGVGAQLAVRCMATMGVDQIFHGTRPGSTLVEGRGSVEVLFFNFNNIAAARTNTRESALDEVQRARLFTESQATVPASVSVTGAPIRFDRGKLLFFGHSQGGLNGPLYLAADDSSRGGVLSGSGALIAIALLEKTKPEPGVAGIVQTLFLGLKGEEVEEMSVFHPGLSFAQTLVDVVDPVNYARHVVEEPRMGFVSKSIYMTEGINPDGTGDNYAPPHGIEVHGIAMGLPLQLPAQRRPAELAWGGPVPVTVPPEGLTGDLALGAASGVLAQWPVAPDKDGHFVVFEVPQATVQAAEFLRNLADQPAGRVPPP